jgi:hypothetical protein
MISRSGNRIIFASALVVDSIPAITATLRHAMKAGYEDLIFDFTDCSAALPPPMLALCARSMQLRKEGISSEPPA